MLPYGLFTLSQSKLPHCCQVFEKFPIQIFVQRKCMGSETLKMFAGRILMYPFKTFCSSGFLRRPQKIDKIFQLIWFLLIHISWEILSNFFGILRKPELYQFTNSIFYLSLFLYCSLDFGLYWTTFAAPCHNGVKILFLHRKNVTKVCFIFLTRKLRRQDMERCIIEGWYTFKIKWDCKKELAP